MFIIRLMLICSALGAVYIAVLLALVVPYLWLGYLVVLIAIACRKTYQSSGAFGTARWANSDDLNARGMIDGN